MGDDGLPYIYGLELPTRALETSKADEDNIVFFIGTQSLRSENQLISVTFDEDFNTAVPVIYSHASGEIWQIVASPTDKQIVATVYSSYKDSTLSSQCSMWKLPIFDDELNESPSDSLTQTTSLVHKTTFNNDADHPVVAISWHPEEQQKVSVFTGESLFIWDTVNEEGMKLSDLSGRSHSRIYSGVWSPHRRGAEIYVLSDSSLRVVDSKSGLVVESLENCHVPQVRDIDFNPFDEFSFATCGDDCCTRFWDRRNMNEPLRVQRDHSHWVWKVRYNLLHDELILSGSSDGHVLLSNFASISSQSSLAMMDDSGDSEADASASHTESLNEGVLKKFEEHEDSVYGVEWSPANPWFCASLSYDGRLVINRVPQNISDAMTLK